MQFTAIALVLLPTNISDDETDSTCVLTEIRTDTGLGVRKRTKKWVVQLCLGECTADQPGRRRALAPSTDSRHVFCHFHTPALDHFPTANQSAVNPIATCSCPKKVSPKVDPTRSSLQTHHAVFSCCGTPTNEPHVT